MKAIENKDEEKRSRKRGRLRKIWQSRYNQSGRRWRGGDRIGVGIVGRVIVQTGSFLNEKIEVIKHKDSGFSEQSTRLSNW